MAQVTFVGTTATVVFDGPDMEIVTEARRRNPGFFQDEVNENLLTRGRFLVQEAVDEDVAREKLGLPRVPRKRFGRPGGQP